MIIGFTGTREGMTDAQKNQLVHDLEWYKEIEWAEAFDEGREEVIQFHHGMCIGADEEAAKIAHGFGYFKVAHPASNLPPALTHKFKSDFVVSAKPPLERNQDIVDSCDILICCPKESEEPKPRRGQGTWSTVRRARKAKKDYIIIWPDGSTFEFSYRSTQSGSEEQPQKV